MRAEPIFGALSSMERALRRAEMQALKADRDGDESLSNWLENFVATTRVWLDRWREVVTEANRRDASAAK